MIIQSFFIFGAQYAFILVALIACLLFLTDKGVKKERFVVFAIISIPIMYIVAEIVGHLYYDPRPFVTGTASLIYHVADNGFPSGHTLFCAAIAAVCTPFFARKWTVILWILTLWVGVSRVYVGVHHWIDIIASILIAVIVAYLVRQSHIDEKVLEMVRHTDKV